MQNGCRRDSPIPGRWRIDGRVYRRCPLRLVSASSWLALRLFRHYERGFLPVAGGLLEQGNAFLQAMEIIGDVLAED